MASKHSVLTTKRQKSLSTLDKACRHHRGVRAARQSAVTDTLRLLRLEVEAQTKARRASKPRESHAGGPDLFQGLH